MDVELSEKIKNVFIHAGVVKSVDIEALAEKVFRIQVQWMPWPHIGQECVTPTLLEAGTIVNDDYEYYRVKKTESTATCTINVDLNESDWRRSMVKQMGYILAQEIRATVSGNA